MQSMIAPKVVSRPAVLMLTSRPDDNSLSMPVGASTEQPVTTFPSINAVGAKRFTTRCVYQLATLMQLHPSCRRRRGETRRGETIKGSSSRRAILLPRFRPCGPPDGADSAARNVPRVRSQLFDPIRRDF